MINLSLIDIAQQVNGTLQGNDLIITNVSTDTREISADSLFIALVGPNFNGHVFANEARQNGAVAMIASEPVEAHMPVIMVEDTKAALGALGAYVKQKVAPKTVGITGSSGKTTVKEMATAILKECGSVLSTQGNFNNDIGVPLTLLRLEAEHEYAVIEMGANHIGEIAYTTGLVKPDVATIVNAAASHLEGFGSLFGVARAKSEIFKGLSKSGTAILNYDSQFYDFWLGKLDNELIYSFSLNSAPGKGADYSASQVGLAFNGCAHFIMHTPIGEMNIELTLPGIHNVGNALLAAALSINVGASLENVRDGLAKIQHVKGRLEVKQLSEKVRLLDDSYNANVASVTAAIKLLSSYEGRRVLVLGDMAELGDQARHYHEQVGELAKSESIEMFYTLGELSKSASDMFGEGGQHFSHIEPLLDALYKELYANDNDITILVKGSRSSRMDRVVTAIEGAPLSNAQHYGGFTEC